MDFVSRTFDASFILGFLFGILFLTSSIDPEVQVIATFS